ncbi:MAG: phage holin [Raoultibacter sp.]
MNIIVRLKNKTFWLTIIPAVLLLIQVCAVPFGYTWDFAELGTQLTAIVNAAFVVLTILGIAVDPTTAGVKDSDIAKMYTKPVNHEVELADAAAAEPEQVFAPKHAKGE